MDKTYIKMSDCPEIQELRSKGKWKAWDYIYAAGYNPDHPKRKEVLVVSGYETDSGFYGPMAGNNMYPDDERVPSDAIWLPHQDQLQKMLGYPLWRLNWDFASWLFDTDNEGQCDFHVRHEHLEFISMEQLWLAFYMDQKHNKVWSEDKWTKKE